MNKFSGRKKKDMLSKIQQARMEVAADVMKAHKKGDMGKCIIKDQKIICEYCEANFKYINIYFLILYIYIFCYKYFIIKGRMHNK